MTNKTHDEILQKWISFWSKKGSLFIKERTELVSPEKLMRSKKIPDNEKLNLFFSINGYKTGKKSRTAKDLAKLNSFFFDIDLKWKNEGVSKKEAWQMIEPFSDHFDFITETAWWYHLFILKDGLYGMDDTASYLSDWKQTWSEFEKAIGLKFDPACYLLTRISRCAWSLHQKNGSTPFPIRLAKGIELLFPQYERQKTIDSVFITEVLEALDIEYQDDRIVEDGRLTNGRKINTAGNYVNDFANKGRPVWWPFAFVKHWYAKKHSLDEKDAIIKAYNFFADNFGIVRPKLKRTTVAVPEIFEKWISGSGLSGKEIQTLLALVSFSRRHFHKRLPYGLRISAYASEILNANGLSPNTSNFVETLKSLERKSAGLWIGEDALKIPVLSLSVRKVLNSRIVDFCLFPEWNKDKKAKRELFFTHYVKKKLFEIGTKSENLRFYLRLCNRLISKNGDFVYELKKKEVCDFFGDWNFSRIKQKIERIRSITRDFTITTTGAFVRFHKA